MPESLDKYLEDNDELLLDKVILKRTTSDGHYSYLVLCSDGTSEVYKEIEYFKDKGNSCYANILS